MFVCIIQICTITVLAGATPQKRWSRLSTHQKSVLEKAFSQNSYTNQTTVKPLALQTGLSEQRIVSWFKTARRKLRHGTQEETLSMGESRCTCKFVYVCTYIYNGAAPQNTKLPTVSGLCAVFVLYSHCQQPDNNQPIFYTRLFSLG